MENFGKYTGDLLTCPVDVTMIEKVVFLILIF